MIELQLYLLVIFRETYKDLITIDCYSVPLAIFQFLNISTTEIICYSVWQWPNKKFPTVARLQTSWLFAVLIYKMKYAAKIVKEEINWNEQQTQVDLK
jgi:hypothetical protein